MFESNRNERSTMLALIASPIKEKTRAMKVRLPSCDLGFVIKEMMQSKAILLNLVFIFFFFLKEIIFYILIFYKEKNLLNNMKFFIKVISER